MVGLFLLLGEHPAKGREGTFDEKAIRVQADIATGEVQELFLRELTGNQTYCPRLVCVKTTRNGERDYKRNSNRNGPQIPLQIKEDLPGSYKALKGLETYEKCAIQDAFIAK
jgi:hypothetical protein